MPDFDTINALLPQTQCEQCGYKGCKPYAEALIQGTAMPNLCVPGGEPTMHALKHHLGFEAPLKLAKPKKSANAKTVRIKEAECIGCTKCLQVCPTDAIIGGPKSMHAIIEAYCTGCELCIPLCPTNCMEVIETPHPAWVIDNPIQQSIANFNKMRHEQRQMRQTEQQRIKNQKDRLKQAQSIQDEIKACLERVKQKKNKPITQYDPLQNP